MKKKIISFGLSLLVLTGIFGSHELTLTIIFFIKKGAVH